MMSIYHITQCKTAFYIISHYILYDVHSLRHICYIILHYLILKYIILYCTILYCTALYYAILYCTKLYYTILCYTILCYTVLYYTTLYYTILFCPWSPSMRHSHLHVIYLLFSDFSDRRGIAEKWLTTSGLPERFTRGARIVFPINKSKSHTREQAKGS